MKTQQDEMPSIVKFSENDYKAIERLKLGAGTVEDQKWVARMLEAQTHQIVEWISDHSTVSPGDSCFVAVYPKTKLIYAKSTNETKLTFARIYNTIKKLWREDDGCIRQTFPIEKITKTLFRFQDGWKFHPKCRFKIVKHDNNIGIADELAKEAGEIIEKCKV